MTHLDVEGVRSLRGTVRVPGDKSISHRCVLLASAAGGTSTITGLSDGDDVRRTVEAVRRLGTDVRASGAGELAVTPRSWRSPDGPIDLGNSGTGMRLLAGLCAGRDVTVELTGDASLRSRPMTRIAEPLRAMGATVTGPDDGVRPPLVVHGGGLTGIEYRTPVPSAQIKSAVLLAGLSADGVTTVVEPSPSRAHTEELLLRMGGDVRVDGGRVELRPGPLDPLDHRVEGDPSQAAFWIVAALVTPGSDVTVEGLYLGAARSGFLDVLDRMGADLEVARAAGAVRARSSALRATKVTEDEIPGLDEIPVLAVAAAFADGETRFRDMAELRLKESDRLAATTKLLVGFGVDAEVDGDDLVVGGGGTTTAATVDAHHDHRIAMSGAVAALATDGTTRVDGWDMVATSYPGFDADLAALGGVQ